jgi:hypothetical protein
MTNTEKLINELRASSNLDDCQLVSRFDRLQRLASVEACLNDEGMEMLANLRGAVIPELHRIRCNRQWLQMSDMAHCHFYLKRAN